MTLISLGTKILMSGGSLAECRSLSPAMIQLGDQDARIRQILELIAVTFLRRSQRGRAAAIALCPLDKCR
jgi:hypothetical protein